MQNFCGVLNSTSYRKVFVYPVGYLSYGVKIRHAGYLHSKNKMERIASVCQQLKLPAPMQKIYTPVALRLLLQTDKDITTCPVCGKGCMKLVKTFIFHNGALVDVAQLGNRGSPKIKKKYAINNKNV